jgi:hypothetical protein
MRLHARRERAVVARRLGRNLQELAQANDASERLVFREVVRHVTGPIVAVGTGGLLTWLSGTVPTPMLVAGVVAVAVAIPSALWWWRRRSRSPR